MKKLVVSIVVFLAVAALVFGVFAIGSSRVNSVKAVAEPIAQPTAEPTQDLQALIDAAVAEALASAQQPTAEAPVVETEKVVETVIVTVEVPCNCTEVVATPVATAEAAVAEEVVVDEAAETFAVGEKMTGVVSMPVFGANGTFFVHNEESAIEVSNRRVDTEMSQFWFSGILRGDPTEGFVREAYAIQEMTWEYMEESTIEFADLLESVVIHHVVLNSQNEEIRYFSARVEQDHGQKRIVRFWLGSAFLADGSESAKYLYIAINEDGEYVVLVSTSVASARAKGEYLAATAPKEPEHHHEDKPGKEDTHWTIEPEEPIVEPEPVNPDPIDWGDGWDDDDDDTDWTI